MAKKVAYFRKQGLVKTVNRKSSLYIQENAKEIVRKDR